MSQSPTDDATGPSLLRYQQGWKALNRLLHTDRSFSGGERNCAFLNTGSGDFATVSAVTGLDFLDDGRAVASCDWDFDGKQDLWFAARTAPRLRFVRNQQSSPNHFVSLMLRGNGTTTNRDAIGARVELFRAGDADSKLIKTRHAGDGFLSQSSGWLHFGLGANPKVERLVVRWPGGGTEEFAGIDVDSFLLVEQGSGSVRKWEPPQARRAFSPTTHQPTAPTAVARIVLPYRLPLPRVLANLQNRPVEENGNDKLLKITGPTIVNVWSGSCPNCLGELTAWSRGYDELTRNGWHVIALNADSDHQLAQVAMDRIQPPFAWGFAESISISNLDLFQRAVLDRWQTMPVPCSFLVDAQGNVAAIYKGPVEIQQLVADASLLKSSAMELRTASTPFPGRWIADTPRADPLRVSSQFVDHAQIYEAIAYLESFVDGARNDTTAEQLADIHYVLALLLDSQNEKQAAIAKLTNGRSLNPNDFRIRTDLGRLLGETGRPADAAKELLAALDLNPEPVHVRRQLAVALIQDGKLTEALNHLGIILKQNPNEAAAHFLAAHCRRDMGEWPSAVAHYREALKIDSGQLLAANNLAYILTAHPSQQIRNETEGLRIAQHACEKTNYKNPQFLDTLAVAYAANGQFDKAIATCKRAIELVPKSNADDSKPIRARLELFEKHKAFRESW